jgi:hypothetical protein
LKSAERRAAMECVYDFALLRKFGSGRWRCALDAAASATSNLARGFWGAADDFGDSSNDEPNKS